MALLRRHYWARVLELGVADLADGPPPEGSGPQRGGSAFAVLKRWSTAAARAVASALAVVQVARQTPGASERPFPWPFVVLGLGRLGLNEFDLASDADLIFLVGSEVARDDMGFWTRVAEKTIEVLSSYTRDGTVFAVDTRLRPSGREGELVVTEEALLSYVADNAQAWEALTYLKAWPLAGHLAFGKQTVRRVVETLLDRFGAHPQLEARLRQMRRRLENEVAVSPDNTKTAPGGYYDVDFAVSCLRLRHRVLTPPGANMAEQIAALRAGGWMSQEDAQTLATGAGFLRSLDHALRLVTGKAAGGLPERVGDAEAVENLLRRWGLITGTETVAQRLHETHQQVRSAYWRLVGED
jgi:glutamate-ammonia-ligase adenylyltransferase